MPDAPAARSTDPDTSHEAARAITTSDRRASLKRQCLAYITAHPGRTAGEIGEGTGLGHDRVWRRISDLKNEGLVQPGRPRRWHGKAQETWWPVVITGDPPKRDPPQFHECSHRAAVASTNVVAYQDGRWLLLRGKRVAEEIIHCPYCGLRLRRPERKERGQQPRLAI